MLRALISGAQSTADTYLSPSSEEPHDSRVLNRTGASSGNLRMLKQFLSDLDYIVVLSGSDAILPSLLKENIISIVKVNFLRRGNCGIENEFINEDRGRT